MSRRALRAESNIPLQDSRDNSNNEENDVYSTPIAKRKHRQNYSDNDAVSNSSRNSSTERHNGNNNTQKPRRLPLSRSASSSSSSSADIDEISTAILPIVANELLGIAVTAPVVGAEAEYLHQQKQQEQGRQFIHPQQEPSYSKWSTIIHQISFLVTGIFSTIAVQWLNYQGAASGTTMLTVFFNYIGMICVGLVYALQSWYSNRWKHGQDRAHVEYDVLTSDLNEMSEIHGNDDDDDGNDNDLGIQDHIELVGRRINSGLNTEVSEIAEAHSFESETDVEKHFKKQKELSTTSTKDVNSKSWIRLQWPVFQVAVMDVIANALVTVGFFYVGSGMYQVIYSSIVIWCAILTRIFLGRKLNVIQWLSIFGVTLGLAISAVGTVKNESPDDDGPVQSWLEKSFGAMITLGATFLYACVYVLSDKVLSTFKPTPVPEKVCSMVGGYASLLTFIYLCIYTFPNWQTEVVDVVEAHHGSKIGIFIVYPLVTISSLLHSLNYYVLLSRINNIAVGIMQSLRAVLVFVMSHYLFCGISSTQCFNEWKFVSAIVVIGCVTLFSFNSPATSHT